MKKRLRKKFRLGEYTEFEFPIQFKLKETPDAAALETHLNQFLDAVESRGLVGGGTFSNEGEFHFSLYASRARMAVTEAHREAVSAWLQGNPAIGTHTVGPLEDAWHPSR